MVMRSPWRLLDVGVTESFNLKVPMAAGQEVRRAFIQQKFYSSKYVAENYVYKSVLVLKCDHVQSLKM